MNHNVAFGRRGEDLATAWYERAGYEVLDRNWRCRRGEIDLIVADAEAVVFVEVKARSSTRFGSGADAVDWRKQRTIRAVAGAWLANSERYYTELRFDVIDVDARGNIIHYEGCF